MTPLLAQTLPPAADLMPFLGCLTFLLLIAVAIKKLREQPNAAPQPFLVQEHPHFVTTLAHDKDIKEIKEELKRHGARRAEIYDTQKEQGAQISALVEKTELMNATQIRQESKIDLILQRLPRP